MTLSTSARSPLPRLAIAFALATSVGAASALPLVAAGTLQALPVGPDVVPIGVNVVPIGVNVVPIGVNVVPIGVNHWPSIERPAFSFAASTVPVSAGALGLGAAGFRSPAVSAVPEPSQATLVVVGLLLLAAWRHWRHQPGSASSRRFTGLWSTKPSR